MLCLAAAIRVNAQAPAPAPAQVPTAPENYTASQDRFERVSTHHWRYQGKVEIEIGSGVKFFADELNLYTDTNRLVATGNVVFVNPEGRISAERVEFNTRDRVGTFYQASGIMSLGEKAERVQFGGQDPDIYFYGDTVEKLGDRKYRITRGAFTTCVQPTPRWELVSGTVTLNLDDYALLTNTVLRVKGVPVFYLPLTYYPLQEDQRATGFLLPTYGTSSIRGQTISNAFFWAINRSQDATFLHDWFSRTGQGYGTEYRYIAGPQSEGNARIYRLHQKEAQFGNADEATTLPELQSFEVQANAVQTIARGLRARSRVDYFSQVVTKQLYHQNIYNQSNPRRVVNAGLTGAWGPYNAAFSYERSEIFSDGGRSFVSGSTPRANAGIAPTRLFGAPIYASVTTEFANLLDRSQRDGEVVEGGDRGLTRFELAPLVRVPMSRWTFLTLNTSAAYRLTRYSESVNADKLQVPEPLTRSYFDLRTEALGPVFTKIWDAAPDSAAERYKHVIEPSFGYQQITSVENYASVPQISNASTDFIVSGVARFTYGLTNRLLRRDRPREGSIATAREFLSIALQQTYYSKPEASRHDSTYVSGNPIRTPVDLSPIAFIVRYSPTLSTSATMRMEHDVSGAGLQSLTASSSISMGVHSVTANLSRSRIIETLPAQTSLGATTNLSFLQGRVRTNYNINWNISSNFVQSQGISATYFAQCCGFGVEFQNQSFAQISSSPISGDRRFNFSFTLAGLGTFSNFFGAFGGNTQ